MGATPGPGGCAERAGVAGRRDRLGIADGRSGDDNLAKDATEERLAGISILVAECRRAFR